MIACEKIQATFTDETGVSATWILPAFTVPADKLRSRVTALLDLYVARSEEEEENMSLADFLMYLVPQAAGDPLMMPDA